MDYAHNRICVFRVRYGNSLTQSYIYVSWTRHNTIYDYCFFNNCLIWYYKESEIYDLERGEDQETYYVIRTLKCIFY